MKNTRKDFKTSRNQRIYEEYKNSDASFNKLAKKHSLTPQRIAAIVKAIDEKILKEGVTTTKESREAYKNLAVELREKGQLKKAATMFEKVIAWDEAHKNLEGLADTLGHQRITYTLIADRTTEKKEKIENLEMAEKLVQKALKTLTDSVSNPKEAIAIQNVHFASVLRKQAELETNKEKESLLKKAQTKLNSAIKDLPGSEAHKAWPLGMRADVEHKMGDTETALETLRLAEQKLSEGYSKEIKNKDQGRIKLRVWGTGIMLGFATIYASKNMPILAEIYASAVLATPDPDGILKNRKREASEIIGSLK